MDDFHLAGKLQRILGLFTLKKRVERNLEVQSSNVTKEANQTGFSNPLN